MLLSDMIKLQACNLTAAGMDKTVFHLVADHGILFEPKQRPDWLKQSFQKNVS